MEGTILLYQYGRVRACLGLQLPKRVVMTYIVNATVLEEVHYV
jgi:hypothetical protein